MHVNDKQFEKEYFEDSHFSKMGGYDLLTRLNAWRPKKYKKIILENITSQHKKLLDIGCAYGHFLEILKDDFDVCGSDISEHAIEIAKKKVDCPYACADLELDGIPFNDKFDIITAISVIEHLKDPRAGLEQIYDHLNPGGLFCFEIPTRGNALSKLFYKLFFSWDETHIFIQPVDVIERLVHSVGFKRIATYASTFPIFTKMRKFVRSLSFVFGVFQKPD